MGENSKIEWCDATWTPIRARFWEIQNDGSGKERIGWHCEHVSEGCRNCYAERINGRLGTGRAFKPSNLFRQEHVGYANGEVKLFLDQRMLTQPMAWTRPRDIFVCSMTDLFASFVPNSMIDAMFAVMALSSQHTFTVLTKRTDRARAYLTSADTIKRVFEAILPLREGNKSCVYPLPHGVPGATWWPVPNVLIGGTAEDQSNADRRRPDMEAISVAGWPTFVSYEPAIGGINWDGWEFLTAIVSGGESGQAARPSHPDWHRATRDWCQQNGIRYGFKQWGEWAPLQSDHRYWPAETETCIRLTPDVRRDDGGWPMQRLGKRAAGRLLDGRTHDEWPGMPL